MNGRGGVGEGWRRGRRGGGGGPGAIVVLETECVLKKRERKEDFNRAGGGGVSKIYRSGPGTYLADKLNAGGRPAAVRSFAFLPCVPIGGHVLQGSVIFSSFGLI